MNELVVHGMRQVLTQFENLIMERSKLGNALDGYTLED